MPRSKRKQRQGEKKQNQSSNSHDNNNNNNNKVKLESIHSVEEICWKPVEVDFDGRNNQSNNSNNSNNNNNSNIEPSNNHLQHQDEGYNHYDNSKLQQQANNDLPVQPGEEIAMFYGLQVLDSTNFEIIKPSPSNPRLLIKKRHTDNNNNNSKTKMSISKSSSSSSSTATQTNQNVKSSITGVATNPTNISRPKPTPSLPHASQSPDLVQHNERDNDKAVNVPIDDHVVVDDDDDDEQLQPRKKKQKRRNKSNNDTPTTKQDVQPIASQTLSSNGKPTQTTSNISTNLPGITQTRQQQRQLVTPAQIRQIQLNWSQACGGALLHDQLADSLTRCNYTYPTPIQAATLSAAMLGRRNIVGAAPTGSGKTLAFLLPILQSILTSDDDSDANADANANDDDHHVRAIIVTPTRELAIQIQKECNLLAANNSKRLCVSLVGGIAIVKQARQLRQIQPKIIVGTPGRMWAMISSGEYEILNDLSKIQFLVLDEADRMTQDHSFPQLLQILETIHQANPGQEQDEQIEDGDDHSSDDSDEEDLLLGLPGIRGETKVTMLTDDILQRVQEMSTEAKPIIQDDGNSGDRESDQEYDDDDNDDNDIDGYQELALTSQPPEQNVSSVHRQTFIFSATLTLPPVSSKSQNPKRGKQKKVSGRQLQGGIGDILNKTHTMGETKIVDLATTATASTKQLSGSSSLTDPSRSYTSVQFPPGLKLQSIKCTQRHKDSHLYAYLVTTVQGSSGPCLIFCNSIAGARRVGATMQKLGLPTRLLHAHMQQKARLKAVESLSNRDSRAIVVCTDVAARGLDIPHVSTVVHYDVARTVDTFVHRSGRTARGVGQDAVGTSLSLISPAEDKVHQKIVQATQVKFDTANLDGRLLTKAQERANLAAKIVAVEDMEQRTKANNSWFRDNAEEAGLEVDSELIEEFDERPQREQQQIKEAHKAKVRLAQLLAQPLKTQQFGKFLPFNSALTQQAQVKPFIVLPPKSKKRKQKRF